MINKCTNEIDGNICKGEDISISYSLDTVSIEQTTEVQVDVRCDVCGNETVLNVPIKAPIKAALEEEYNKKHPKGTK